MANDHNVLSIKGRLAKDPELKYTQGGTAVASFSLANNYTTGKDQNRKDCVSFFNCVAWGKTGENIAQYFKKGNRILIDGKIQQRSWEDQNGGKRSTVEIVVEKFDFLDYKDSNSSAPTQSDPVPAPSTPAEQALANAGMYGGTEGTAKMFNDEDIPF